MVVRIRLARFGKRYQPVYNIVVAQQKSGRNKKPMEVIGTYDPIPKVPLPGEGHDVARKYKDIKLDSSRAKYWLGVGAQPSDTVWRLFSMLGLVEPRHEIASVKQQTLLADERHRAHWEAQKSNAVETDSPSSPQQPSPSQP